MITPVDKYSKGAYIVGDVFNPAGKAGMQKEEDQSIYIVVYICLAIILLIGLIVFTSSQLVVRPSTS